MNVSANSQSGIILKHLLEYGYITSWDAIERYHITRLSAVIKILRDAGFDIATDHVKCVNKSGAKTHYGVYRLGGRESA